jgi:hypothetical protein
MTGPPNVEAFLSNLERLPPYQGIVFRGCDEASHQRWPERAVVTQGVLATSRDPLVATHNFTTPAVYAILTRTGRAIEQFSAALHEREVVLLPGTVLTQVTRVRFDDLPITVVEEFDSQAPAVEPTPLDQAQARIAKAIREAQAADNAPEPLRDRFVGDIS